MSKSKGNTVSPGDYVERYGADTARTYVCFMGPPERGGDWTDEGVEGVHRFLSRLWRLCEEVERARAAAGEPAADAGRRRRASCSPRPTGRSTRSTRDFERGFQFNTAIAAVMELVNDAYRLKDGLYGDPTGDAARALRDRDRRLADLPLRAAPRRRGLRAADRRAGLGAALARGRPGAAGSATPSPSSSRSTASCATGSRPPADAPRGGAAASWRARARRSARTSTARRSSRRSSCPASWSTWWSARARSRRRARFW